MSIELNTPWDAAKSWLDSRGATRQEKYQVVIDSEERDAPVGGLTKRFPHVGPEIDEWVHHPMAAELCALLLDGEDFAFAPEEQQRIYLLLAAEALYGPRHDAVLLALAVMEASTAT